MKTPIYFFLPLFLFVFISCSTDENEIIEGSASITNIAMLTTTTGNKSQDITVTFAISAAEGIRTEKTVNGNVFNYNFIVFSWAQEGRLYHAAMVDTNVVVSFDPPSNGDYTINFLINGRLFETRSVKVEG